MVADPGQRHLNNRSSSTRWWRVVQGTQDSAYRAGTSRRGLAIDAGIPHLRSQIQSSLGRPEARRVDVARLADVDVAHVIGPLALLVVGQRASDGRPIQSIVARIRELCPHVGIFLVTEGGHVIYHRLAAYGRVGIDEVVELTDDLLLARFVRMIQARIEAPPPEEALWHVSDLTQPSFARVSQWCIRNSYRRRRTEAVASRFGLDRSTLQRRCTDACGVTPNELLRLGRLLHFEELRQTTSLTRQQIVMRLGMESPSAISMLKTRLLQRLPLRWRALLHS